MNAMYAVSRSGALALCGFVRSFTQMDNNIIISVIYI